MNCGFKGTLFTTEYTEFHGVFLLLFVQYTGKRLWDAVRI